MKNSLRLVEIEAGDGLPLPGLLYAPSRRTRRAAILLHGMGNSSVFYSTRRVNSFGEVLAGGGTAFLAFNNRGANYIKDIKFRRGGEEVRERRGSAFELIRDCVADIDGAVAFLRGEGYREFYLIGHSSGANKICVYNYRRARGGKRNPFAGYVLIGGGDDTGLYYEMAGARKFREALRKAGAETRRGNGAKLAPKYLTPFIISYQSLFDILNPDGEYNVFPFNEAWNKLGLARKRLFREYRSIRKPTLVVYGSEDEFCYGDVGRVIETLREKAAVPGKFRFEMIAGADHSFHGKEQELAEMVAGWIKERD